MAFTILLSKGLPLWNCMRFNQLNLIDAYLRQIIECMKGPMAHS